MRLFSKEKPAHGRVPAAAAGGEGRFREKAKEVKKTVAAFGGPVKPHKPIKAAVGGNLADKKQPKEDRRPSSMSTIERKRGVEGLGLKLPKIGGPQGLDRRKSDHEALDNNKPFTQKKGDKVAQGGMMGLLNKKGGPIRVAYEENDGLDDRGRGRRIHSPVSTNGAELRGESEYISISGDDEAMAGAQLDMLLRQAKNARVAPSGPSAKAFPGGNVKKSSSRR